jgi:hypothetical protein
MPRPRVQPTTVHDPSWPVSRATYRHRGCRCEDCKACWREEHREYDRRRKLSGRPARVVEARPYRPVVKLATDSWPGRP